VNGFKCILVPLDGLPLSERALSGATALAHEFRSEVILLHVLNIPMPPLSTSHPEAESGWMKAALACAYRKAREYLDVQQQEVCRHGIEVRTLMSDRSPAKGILEVAAGEKVDLIVMNGQGQQDSARWNLSRIADTVARQSSCPVLLMPSAAQGERG
jgi:nucleotide-binding universal stress UspA family protein